VQQVIDEAKRITARTFAVDDAPMRAGDPAPLIADSRAAKLELGWQPRLDKLGTIIAHAWNWERKVAGI
jgi:UDP-glucose 4-epimerase